MDDVLIRQAGAHDLNALLPLVGSYHLSEKVSLDEPDRRRAVADLLANPALGLVLRLDVDGIAAGYAAVCFGYSIEFGGRDAFLDELYLVPKVRGHGLGSRLLAAAKASATSCGARALHLEVDADNDVAHLLYARHGFKLRGGFKMMSAPLIT